MIDLKEKTSSEVSGVKLEDIITGESQILGKGEKLNKGDFFQQGDCILVQLGDENFIDAPTEIKGEKQKSNLVLKGITNSHALYEGDFDIYSDGVNLFVDVKTYTILDHVRDENSRVHAEHHAQYIPAGKYFFRGVTEFDHLEKLARQVID